MSNAETPMSRRIFQTVSEFVMYIPRAMDNEITKGMNQAIKIIIPGRLEDMQVMYLYGWTMAV